MAYILALLGVAALLLIAIVIEDMLDDASHDERTPGFEDVMQQVAIDAPYIGILLRERARRVPA